MTKLQAAMKDKSAKNWRERKLYYRVGGCVKGCQTCGKVDPERERHVWSEVFQRKVLVQHYVCGYQVFRSFSPIAMGWTFKCFECGAIDVAAWGPSPEIGKEPRILPGYDLRAESRREHSDLNPKIEYKRRLLGLNKEDADEEKMDEVKDGKIVARLMPKERMPRAPRLDARALEIMALEKKLAELVGMLGK
jgi:hypothetical protein